MSDKKTDANLDGFIGKTIHGPAVGRGEHATGVVLGYQYDERFHQNVFLVKLNDGTIATVLAYRVERVL